MFLAETLNSKLLANTLEKGAQEITCKFPYTKKEPDPRILEIRAEKPPFNRESLHNMSKKEFFDTFNLLRLHSKWNRKFPLQYKLATKKFFSECTSNRAKSARIEVKEILDPDIFERKIPKWNKSTKVNDKEFREPLKKTIFEVKHGLNKVHVTELKDKIVEEGTDSRDVYYYPDIDWFKGTVLEEAEKKTRNNYERVKSAKNTARYWEKNSNKRAMQEPFPMSEDRKKVEKVRYFKKYMNPEQLTKYYYDAMKQAKRFFWIENEKGIKDLKKEYPNSSMEKVLYLLNEKMQSKYMDKFDVLTGKKVEKQKENTKINSYWKDTDLSNKIISLSNWEDLKWFKSSNQNNEFSNMTQDDIRKEDKRELLKHLIPCREEIIKEKEKIISDQKEEQKRLERIDQIKKKTEDYKDKYENPLKKSKYPMDVGKYNYMQASKINEDELPPSIKKIREENDLFLNAYKNVVQRNQKNTVKRNASCKERGNKNKIIYKHPGVYREFVNKVIDSKDNEVEERYMAWSCCNKLERNALGCHKQKIETRTWSVDYP